MSYTAIGVDECDNLYVVFGDDGQYGTNSFGGVQDCYVFKYIIPHDSAIYLGSLRETAEAAGNLEDDEPFFKGHTHIVQLGNKMYFGTQAFHDINEYMGNLNDTVTIRGGHIFSISIPDGELVDESVNHPDGVFVKHQGINSLTASPWDNLLFGLTLPSGHIVIYDPETEESELVQGIRSEVGPAIGREIIATPEHKVYSSYSSNTVYAYDVNTKNRSKVNFGVSGAFWNGQCRKKDGSNVYFNTGDGNIYELNTRTENCRRIGSMGGNGLVLWTLAFSPDEDKLYGIPSCSEAKWGQSCPSGNMKYNLVEMDISSGNTRSLVDLNGKFENSTYGQYSGSQAMDSRGSIYFIRCDDYDDNLWRDDGDVVQFDFGYPEPDDWGKRCRTKVSPKGADQKVQKYQRVTAKVEAVTFYDLRGRVVPNGNVKSAAETLNKGIYIVRTGGSTTREASAARLLMVK
ncbi:MAG: WD40 repeat domain-containing protein [Chitinispirillaceae bacterium]|nr:WD40 repeat domain-containing protein [Chitinispirillaceae bacterium]